MRVLVNALSVAPGGGDTVARFLVRALADLEPCDEYVVVVKDQALERSEQWPDNVRFVDAGRIADRAGSRTLWEQAGLRRLLRRERCDVLFGLGGLGLVTSGYPQVVAVRNAYFFVRQPWMSNGSRMRNFARRRLQIASIRAGAYAGCVSGYMRDLLLARMEVRNRRIAVIPHGTDMSLLSSVSVAAAGERDLQAFPVFWLGNASLHKNLGELIESLPLAESILGRSIELWIAGTFSRADRGRYERMARSVGLSRPLSFLGYLDRDGLRLAYLRSAIYVSTSRLESFDNGVLEALALGVPVVATDIPARDAVRPVVRTYTSGDAVGLASVLAELLVDDVQRAEMSSSGRALASAFTWQRSAIQYRKLLAKAVAERGSR